MKNNNPTYGRHEPGEYHAKGGSKPTTSSEEITQLLHIPPGMTSAIAHDNWWTTMVKKGNYLPDTEEYHNYTVLSQLWMNIEKWLLWQEERGKADIEKYRQQLNSSDNFLVAGVDLLRVNIISEIERSNSLSFLTDEYSMTLERILDAEKCMKRVETHIKSKETPSHAQSEGDSRYIFDLIDGFRALGNKDMMERYTLLAEEIES